MTPNPIRKVLSTMTAYQVRALLMGGQACVFYGAAEFSRDTDLVVLADAANWQRLIQVLDELQAERIYFPPAELSYLWQGHALHFRCHHPEANEMRVDIMSVMRGVDEFPALWERRTTLEDEGGTVYEILSLPDLVKAKKTQRDRDWPMIRRLVEVDYLRNRSQPDDAHLRFWLRELRTAELILEVASMQPLVVSQIASERPLLELAHPEKRVELEAALDVEEKLERARDRAYWKPLKEELERLRHAK